jgi:hypothetical protein
MSCHQNARLNHNLMIANKSLRNVKKSNIWEQLQVRITFMKKRESRLTLAGAYYHSVQNLLTSSFLPKNLVIKM